MAYRKVEVDGKEYEYTIGKQFLKIKGLRSYNIWGIEIESSVGKHVWPDHPKITPAVVKLLIQEAKQNES